MPSIEILFAPILIGVYLNTVLYGILLVQSFIYYRTYRRDDQFIRYFVLYLVICDTLNTVIDIGITYEPLVFRYGTQRAVERVPILLPFDPLITVIISSSVQLFICWRIKVVSKSWAVPCFIGTFIFCSLAGGIATCICGTIFVDFDNLDRFNGAVITWLASSAIVDISITSSLVFSLLKRRTGHTQTDDAIDRIIRLTIHTGAVTALFATMDLVLFVALPGTSLNFAFDFPLAKLYTNSLLSTLNARGGWYTIAETRPRDNVLFGSLNWDPNNNGNLKADHYIHNRKSIPVTGSLTVDVVELTAISHSTAIDCSKQQSDDVYMESMVNFNDSQKSILDIETGMTNSIPTFAT